MESFESLLVALVFIMPGFIVVTMKNWLAPGRKLNEKTYVVTCLIFSIINNALFAWAYKLVIPLFTTNKVMFWFCFYSTAIVSSMILGTIIGFLQQKHVLARLKVLTKGKRLIDLSNIYPSAWDFVFMNQSASFVKVTLTDGTEVLGQYNSSSFSSSNPEERDLYLEKVYRYETKADGKKYWKENSKVKGILIAKDQIKTIEFVEGGN